MVRSARHTGLSDLLLEVDEDALGPDEDQP
jgi:hypothetical protein